MVEDKDKSTSRRDGDIPSGSKGPQKQGVPFSGRSGTSKKGSKPGSGTPWRKPGTGSTGGTGTKGAEEIGEEEIARHGKPIRKIGEGSFGSVWLVEYLGALEAHKYLQRGSDRDAFREAVNTRTVNHPNVVRVVDVIEEEGIPALRMEYVEGKNLQHLVEEEGVFPVEKVLPLAIQIADALRATHERGIVHLDLKPSNLILREEGKNVVVTDFGISAALRWKEGELVGGGGGTPYFMAPELHEKGRSGSTGADIWSLGVSLYYLVTGTYPFPFDEMAPEEAVHESPRDPCNIHRYVTRAFWKILKRMLSVSPEERFPSMNALVDDLEKLAHSLTCPDCGQTFRMKSIADACPNPDCQSLTMASLKRAVFAKRMAETALAGCSFEAAREKGEKALTELKKLVQHKPALGDETSFLEETMANKVEVEAFLHSLAGLEKEHEDSVNACEELMDRDRLIEGIHRFHDTRLLFSRSEALKKVRSRIRERLVAVYESTPEKVEQNIRITDFEAADEELRRLEHILGDELARNELRAGLEGEIKDLTWLREMAAKRKKHYQRLQKNGLDAIQAFQFKEALNIFTQLEGDFSSEKNRELLTKLGRGKASFERQAPIKEETLRELISEPEKAGAVPNLMLKEGLKACQQLLTDFPPDQFPAFDKIRERAELMQQARERLQSLVEDCLTKAREAQEAQDLLEENRLLETIKDVVLGSDLFDEQTRSILQERLRVTGRDAGEAEKLFKEGQESFQAREYPKALADLREVQRLAPGMYKGLETLLQQIESRQEEVRVIREDLSKHLSLIDQGDYTNAYAALETAERLYAIGDNRERKNCISDLASACTKILDNHRDILKAEVDLAPEVRGIETAAYFHRTLVPLTELLPRERWVTLMDTSREFRRSLCELFDAARPDKNLEFEILTRNMDPLLDVLESGCLAAALRACEPPRGAVHPALGWGEVLLETVRRESGRNKNFQFEDADEIIERLVQICPQGLRDRVEQYQGELKKRSRKASFLLQFARVRGWVKAYLWIIVAGVIASFVFFNQGRNAGKEQMRSRIEEDVKDMGLVEEQNYEGLVEWVVDYVTHPNSLSRRLGALNAWQGLKEALKKGKKNDLELMISSAVAHKKIMEDEIQSMDEEAATPKQSPDFHRSMLKALNKDIATGMTQILNMAVEENVDDARRCKMLDKGGVLPCLLADLEAIDRLHDMKEVDVLLTLIVDFEDSLKEDVLTPLREDGWEGFSTDQVDSILDLSHAQLNDLPVETREKISYLFRDELRRNLVLELKAFRERILGESVHQGTVQRYTDAIMHISLALDHLRRLGPLPEMETDNIDEDEKALLDTIHWVNEFFGPE